METQLIWLQPYFPICWASPGTTSACADSGEWKQREPRRIATNQPGSWPHVIHGATTRFDKAWIAMEFCFGITTLKHWVKTDPSQRIRCRAVIGSVRGNSVTKKPSLLEQENGIPHRLWLIRLETATHSEFFRVASRHDDFPSVEDEP